MGLRVPEDVQLIGFDGIRKFGDMELVCSTIVQPVDAIAETCLNMILNTDPGQIPSLLCLPVRYECGGTTLK
jgi:LacI family transcriptional regulator